MKCQKNKESEKQPKESAVENYRISLPLSPYLEGKGYPDLENTREPEEQSLKKNEDPVSTFRKKKRNVKSTGDAPARKKSKNKHLHLSLEKQDSALKSAEKPSSASALSTSAASGCSVFEALKTEAQGLSRLDSNLPICKESCDIRAKCLKQIELSREEVLEAEKILETFQSCLISLKTNATPLINDLNAIAAEAKNLILK